MSWQGATVTLSRERKTPVDLPTRTNTPSPRGDELVIPEPLEGGVLEPLLPPGSVGVPGEEEQEQGVGEGGTPGFSLRDVFLSVRPGEVRLAAADYSGGRYSVF